MSCGTTQTGHRLTAIRKRLDQMGYLQTLGVESLPLVERLFNDLVQTIESLRTVKKEAVKLQKNCSLFESSVEPYKIENGRLHAENTKLKHQLITEKEKFESLFREEKIHNRKLDQENSDLRFLNSQYLLKVKTLENESREKSEKILELQEKNLQAVIQTPGGKKQPIAFRRQRLEISSPPPSLAQPSTLPQVQHQCKDAYVADILKAADSSMIKLREQIQSLNKKLQSVSEEKDVFRNQISVRDMEINRLSKLLEKGRAVEAVIANEIDENKNELIMHLRMQVSQLEAQNEKLSQELRKLPQKAEKDKTSRVHFDGTESVKSTRHISKEKRIEEELWDQLKSCKKSLNAMQTENDELKHQINLLKGSISGSDEQTIKLENLILEINKDKDKLSQKVKELTNNEKELLLEIDRLSRNSSSNKNEKNAASVADNENSDTIDSLMSYVAQLESQRDQYKEETRALLKLLQSSRGKISESNETSPKIDNAMLKLMDEERNFYKKQYHELLEEHMSKERRRAPSGCVSTVDKSVSATENELGDEAKQDMNNYNQLVQIKIEQLQENVNLLSREKEELLQQLKGANEEIVKLQNDVAQMQLVEDTRGQRSSVEQDDAIDQLSKENDQLGRHCQILQNENSNLQDRVALLESQLRNSNDNDDNVSASSLSKNDVISKLTDERNDALRENEQLRKQNNSLVQEYQRVQATLLNEKAQLEERINEMEEIRIPSEKDDSVKVKEHKPKGRLSTVETEVVGLKYKVRKNQNEIETLKQQLTESERNMERLRHQLREKDGEIQLAEANLNRQTSKLEQLQNIVEQQTTEIHALKSMISTMESEKGDVNSEQIQRDFEFAGLTHHLQHREAEAQTLQASYLNMESYVESMRAELKDKDLALTKLKFQSVEQSNQISSLESQLDTVTRENKRLLQDLTSVTTEHQRIGDDLASVTNDKLALQRQIQEYVTEVKRIQELLILKEKEQGEILEQYQHLSQENNLLESQNKELEAQNSSVTHVLVSKDTELKQCQETIHALDSEVQMHLSAQQNYQYQLSNLNASVQELEAELHQAKSETSRLREELDATRDICKSLDETNHHISKQLYTEESDKDLLSKRLLELQEEMVQLREHLAVSRTSVNNLESLMITTREKEFRQQLTRQEMSAEVEHLRNRLKETEERMENQCKEMASYKTQVKKLEMDIDRTKRQLTNERFEKERVNQEVKRLKQQRTLDSESAFNLNFTSAKTTTTTNIPSAPAATVSQSVIRKESSQTEVKKLSMTTPVSKRIAAAFGDRKLSGESNNSSSKSD